MKKLNVQQYLLNHSFGELAKNHGVYVSFAKSGYKFSLNYDMLEAKESDLLAQQCRGLILATDGSSLALKAKIINGKLNFDDIVPGETTVLAYGMDRFFNFGQGSAANIDFNDPNIFYMDKVDGTCIILYFDPFKNEWCVATRSVPEADIPLTGGYFTFRTLFEKAIKDTLNKTFEEFVYPLDKEITYCFELTSPYNKIVVKYNNTSLTLLAARSILTFDEIDLNSLQYYFPGVPLIKTYSFKNVYDVIDWVAKQNPLESEGIVVKDSNFNRIKIKNPAHVLYAKAADSLGTSDRNCLEVILLEKDDDIVPMLPNEIADNLLNIKQKYVNWLKLQEELYSQILNEALKEGFDKKTFAMTVSKYKGYSSAFYNIFDKKADSVKDFINKSKKQGTWSNSFLDHILSVI